MRTEIFSDEIERAADIIAAGGLVAVPTETVYGLAADGTSPSAVDKLYAVKGRPAGKPVSLLVSGPEAIEAYCMDVSWAAHVLAERYWPGPLTLVLKARPGTTPEDLRAGGETLGLRCPDHKMTLDLLRMCGVPLAAPSANPSGAESPKTAQAVWNYFDGKIEAILDGGPCTIGRESTVVDLSGGECHILRQGALSAEDIRQTLVESLQIIGITGGTGAGKTTALDSLKDMGALVIDADEVYHDLCRDCTEMLDRIDERFPGSVEDGVLQRKKLGNIVFADSAALEDLRQITDRYVEREVFRLLFTHAAAGGRYAAIDAINLLDTQLCRWASATVGITAPEEARVQRLIAREGITEEYALMRIHAQPPTSYFEENCDYTIYNDGSREEYRRRCDELFTTILEAEPKWMN